MNNIIESQHTPHISPSRASYGVSVVTIFEENWPRYNGTALYTSLWHKAIGNSSRHTTKDFNFAPNSWYHLVAHHSSCEHVFRYISRSLVAYGSGKRMVTGTRAGSRIKTENFKRRFLPNHKSQRRDIWCTYSPVVSYFNPKFVDRSVPYEAKQRRVTFRRCFGNIPLADAMFRYRTAEVPVPNQKLR